MTISMSSFRPITNLHSAAVNSSTIKESQQAYNLWSRTYDEDVKISSYVLPKVVAEVCGDFIPNKEETAILDLGAGTGLFGYYLRNNEGYVGNIDILDANMEMLYVASKKGLNFRSVFCHQVNGPLPMRDETYDAVVCLGSILPQHCPPSTIEAMLDAIKPDGFLIFNFRQSKDEKFNIAVSNTVQRLIDQKEMVIAEKSIHEVYKDHGETVVYVCKKL